MYAFAYLYDSCRVMSHSMPELGWTIRRTKKAVRSELAQAPKAARAEIAKSLTAKPYKQGK